MRLEEPIDQLHADCLEMRNRIRQAYRRLHGEVMSWEPAPMPVDYQPTRHRPRERSHNG